MKKYIRAVAGIFLGLGIITTPAYAQIAVNTSAQAAASASGTFAADTRASDIAVTAASVGMTYPVKAKLFGVLPITLQAKVQVASDGSVTIHYPWYVFLFSTDQAELQTKLEAVGRAASTWDTNTLTAGQQTTLLVLVHTALQSNLEASSSVSGSVQ